VARRGDALVDVSAPSAPLGLPDSVSRESGLEEILPILPIVERRPPSLRARGLSRPVIKDPHRKRRFPVMSAYVIVETDVTDAERYEQYKAAAPTAIAAAGGRHLVRGGELVVFEGASTGQGWVRTRPPYAHGVVRACVCASRAYWGCGQVKKFWAPGPRDEYSRPATRGSRVATRGYPQQAKAIATT
jgi:uncharacterized protein (DUF1330 family)